MKVKVDGVTRPIVELRRELLKKSKNFQRGMGLTMFSALSVLEAEIMKNIRSKFNVGTGNLLNSVPRTKEVTFSGDEVIGNVGSDTPYSRIHELGGDIFPTSSKYLKFPHPDNRRADGGAIIDSVSDASKAFIPLKKGGFLIAMKLGQSKQIIPLFLLKKMVTIPARPYLRPALTAKTKEIEDKFENFLENFLE